MTLRWTIKIIICCCIGYGGMYYVLGEYHKETERILAEVKKLHDQGRREIKFVNWPETTEKKFTKK